MMAPSDDLQDAGRITHHAAVPPAGLPLATSPGGGGVASRLAFATFPTEPGLVGSSSLARTYGMCIAV